MSVVRRLTGVFVVVTLGVMVGAAPASAHGRFYQPPTPYANKYHFDPECPGLAIKVRGHNSGCRLAPLRSGLARPGVPPQGSLQLSARHGATSRPASASRSPGTGSSRRSPPSSWRTRTYPRISSRRKALVGPVYLFKAKDIGQPFIVKKHGKTVLRDRGVIVQEYLFDTLGDSQPGRHQLSFEITKVIGPHPGLDVDICELAERLTT